MRHRYHSSDLSKEHSHSLPAHPHPVPPAVSEHLLERLVALPFADFVDLCARLLGRMGYQQVEVMGAMHEKGRNLHGGFDLTAQVQTGLTRALVLVQVKQYKAPVPRCFIDGLRGAMVRLGAQQGAILCTDTFSPSARDAAQAGQHTLPLRLVGGSELVRLLLEHEVLPEPADVRKERAVTNAPLEHRPSDLSERDAQEHHCSPGERHRAHTGTAPKERNLILTVRFAPDIPDGWDDGDTPAPCPLPHAR